MLMLMGLLSYAVAAVVFWWRNIPRREVRTDFQSVRGETASG